LTIPYEGKGSFRIFRFGDRGEFLERRFDCDRLAKLLTGFTIVESSFFLCILKHPCKFIPVRKMTLDNLSPKISEGSLACFILRKNFLAPVKRNN